MAGKDGGNIIIVKKSGGHGAHAHSSGWKIAFADFATAMMALFLVLWLVAVSDEVEKISIAGFFADPVGFKDGGFKSILDLGGRGPAPIDNQAVSSEIEEESDQQNPASGSDQSKSKDLKKKAGIGDEGDKTEALPSDEALELAKNKERKKLKEISKILQLKIEENKNLKPYKDQVLMKVTDEGLKIEIVDKEFRPMFESGSVHIQAHMLGILEELGKTLAAVPNRVSLEGHTDATLLGGRDDYSNWELSSDRAHSARRILQESGLRDSQIIRVTGFASSDLHFPQDPENPMNRRISILVHPKLIEKSNLQ